MGSQVQSKVIRTQKRIVSHEVFISRVTKSSSIDQKFYAELKKVHFMGSEMQAGVMRAQKREILKSNVTKILHLV
jgi:hypothetical protein